MKKVLLVVGLIGMTLGMNAQNETFTVPSEKGGKLEGQYVVMDIKGSAKENYKKTISMINKMYNTPSEVIKAEIDGEYIRVQGVSDLFRNLPSTHTLEFKFKQDKIRIKLLNITSRGSEGMVNVIGFCTYDKSHKKDGKPKNRALNYGKEVVNGMNGLLASIKEGIKEGSSVDNDNDW